MEHCQQWVRGKCRRSQCKFIHDLLQQPSHSATHHSHNHGDLANSPPLPSMLPLITVADTINEPQQKKKNDVIMKCCVYIKSNGRRCKCIGIFVGYVSGGLYCNNHYQLIHQNQSILPVANSNDDDTDTIYIHPDTNTNTNNKRMAHSLAVPIRQVKRVSAKSRMVNPFEVHHTVGGVKKDRNAVVDRASFSHPEHDLILDIGKCMCPHCLSFLLLSYYQ